MIIGKSPHVILGQEMLKPRDGSGKRRRRTDRTEKWLIERLKKRHGHFADVIVADALYLNAPFINTLKEKWSGRGDTPERRKKNDFCRMQSVCSNRMREKTASFWKGKNED
mgnify:CR=1 FL=1